MRSNIRFRVHNEPYNETYIDQLQYNFDNTSEAMFAIMNMVTVMEPLFNILSPLQIAIQNSETDLQLRRNENLLVQFKEQSYNTTTKKYDACTICTDNFNESDTVGVLNCGHIYHPKCIQEWGKYKPNCPVCKAEIFVEYNGTIEDID